MISKKVIMSMAQFELRYVAGMHNTGLKDFDVFFFLKWDKIVNNYFFDPKFLPYFDIL